MAQLHSAPIDSDARAPVVWAAVDAVLLWRGCHPALSEVRRTGVKIARLFVLLLERSKERGGQRFGRVPIEREPRLLGHPRLKRFNRLLDLLALLP